MISSKHFMHSMAVATSLALPFAAVSATVMARQPRIEKNLLTANNLCKPGTLKLRRLGEAGTEISVDPGFKFIVVQLTLDKLKAEGKFNGFTYYRVCELQDFLKGHIEENAPWSTPHKALGVFNVHERQAFTADVQDKIKMSITQYITGGLLSTNGRLDHAASLTYMDTGLTDYVTQPYQYKTKINGSVVIKERTDITPPLEVHPVDKRPLFVQLITQHKIEIAEARRQYAEAGYNFYREYIAGVYGDAAVNIVPNELDSTAQPRITPPVEFTKLAILAQTNLDLAEIVSLEPTSQPSDKATTPPVEGPRLQNISQAERGTVALYDTIQPERLTGTFSSALLTPIPLKQFAAQ